MVTTVDKGPSVVMTPTLVEPEGTQRPRRETMISKPINEIDTPGAYLVENAGWLLRVPPDAIAAGGGMNVSVTSKVGVMVTRLSEDPWVPVGQARSLAARLDFSIAF